jgi:hypothetical protein
MGYEHRINPIAITCQTLNTFTSGPAVAVGRRLQRYPVAGSAWPADLRPRPDAIQAPSVRCRTQLEPGFRCVRTRKSRVSWRSTGARLTRTVMLMVLVWPESGFLVRTAPSPALLAIRHCAGAA